MMDRFVAQMASRAVDSPTTKRDAFLAPHLGRSATVRTTMGHVAVKVVIAACDSTITTRNVNRLCEGVKRRQLVQHRGTRTLTRHSSVFRSPIRASDSIVTHIDVSSHHVFQDCLHNTSYSLTWHQERLRSLIAGGGYRLHLRGRPRSYSTSHPGCRATYRSKLDNASFRSTHCFTSRSLHGCRCYESHFALE